MSALALRTNNGFGIPTSIISVQYGPKMSDCVGLAWYWISSSIVSFLHSGIWLIRYQTAWHYSILKMLSERKIKQNFAKNREITITNIFCFAKIKLKYWFVHTFSRKHLQKSGIFVEIDVFFNHCHVLAVLSSLVLSRVTFQANLSSRTCPSCPA
jgi:hypothetical protein